MSPVLRLTPPSPIDSNFGRNYTSIDPAPPASRLISGGQPKTEYLSDAAITDLKTMLLNTQKPLFERYRAMFALRDIGTHAAVDALASGFSDDSDLFK